LLDFLGLMQLGVVDDDGERGEKRGRMRALERSEQSKKEPGRFALPHPLRDRSRGQVQGTSQIAFLIGAWGQHLPLFPCGHPLRADLGQQIAVQRVGKEQRGPYAQLFNREANPRSRRHAVGIIILGGDLRPFPCPAHLMEPRAQGLR
jgi:hypothetical protein